MGAHGFSVCQSIVLISLLSVAVLLKGNQYAPRLFPSEGPFVQDWYTRIIDFESNHSFGILFGHVVVRKGERYSSEHPLNILSLIHSKGDESSVQSFSVYTSTENVRITSEGKAVTNDPDFKSHARFEWNIKPYGYFNVTENGTLFNFTDVKGVSFIGVLGPPRPWGPNGEGPEGWTNYVPWLHWFVYSVGSELLNYNWVNSETGEMLRGSRGVVHQEKNWGENFPVAWIWAEGVDGTSMSSFTVSLQVPDLKSFYTPAHLIGYRSPSVTINDRPSISQLTQYIDGCNGFMNVTVLGKRHRVIIEVQAAPSTLETCQVGPTLDGFGPVCVKSFVATGTVHIYQLTLNGYQLIETRVFQFSALEFCGLYLCWKNNPCQQS